MRPLTGTAADAGRLDGLTDGMNARPCDPWRRWCVWHPGRPEADWHKFRDAYLAAFIGAAKSRKAAAL